MSKYAIVTNPTGTSFMIGAVLKLNPVKVGGE